MITANLPTSPADVSAKASSPVAAVVATMRKVGAAGEAVSADQIREWGDTLLLELYSTPPVRWEYRKKDDVGAGCWVAAKPEHVFYSVERGLVVRGLWDAPRVQRPDRAHVFEDGACTGCDELEYWAGPDCKPPVKVVDPRTLLPIDPRWLVQPLQWLRDACPGVLNRYERERRSREAAFLLEKIEAHILECQKP